MCKVKFHCCDTGWLFRSGYVPPSLVGLGLRHHTPDRTNPKSSRSREPKLPALRQKTQLHHDAAPNTVSQHSVVLPSRCHHSRHLIDSLSCQAHPPADPNPQCLDPRQAGQQCRRHQKQKTSWSRSLLRPRQDFRTRPQGSKTAWKGQTLVPRWPDTFDREARPEGLRQLVSASGGGAITFCAPPNRQETA